MTVQQLNAEKAFRTPADFGDGDILLNRKEAAHYLRKSVPTLERWAKLGLGPKPRYAGRLVVYTLRDLRAFVDQAA